MTSTPESLLKNFIYDFEAEAWSFNKRGDVDDVLDITCDKTGCLHEVAKRNLPAYVNETDGKETPSVFADHDPEGSVHYLLGHKSVKEGDLVIPMDGQWMEIKVDYGAVYERVRVRKNYSRLSEENRLEEEMKLQNESYDTMNDIEQWSVDDVEKSISYINSLELETPPKTVACRALVLSVCFNLRLKSVEKEFNTFDKSKPFCDNGLSTLRSTQAKSLELFRKLFRMWYNHDLLSANMISDNSCSIFISHLLGCGIRDIKSIPGKELRDNILQIMNLTEI